jgi:hypothetical protein
MKEIALTLMAPGEFGVEVTEGTDVTGHRVRVPEEFLDDLLLGGVDPEVIVRESFTFLLEREPATSIMREFSLDDIARYFPEYPEELRRRLA